MTGKYTLLSGACVHPRLYQTLPLICEKNRTEVMMQLGQNNVEWLHVVALTTVMLFCNMF